jgi:hypothetical protein
MDKEYSERKIADMKEQISDWKNRLNRLDFSGSKERRVANQESAVHFKKFIREEMEDIDEERQRHENLKQTVRQIVKKPSIVNSTDKEVIRAESRLRTDGIRTVYPTEIQQSAKVPRRWPIDPNMPQAKEIALTKKDKRRQKFRNIGDGGDLPEDMQNEIRDFLAPKPNTRAVPVVAQRELGQAEELEGTGISKPKSMNKWIAFVKEYAKKHGVTYSQAMKDAKATYKK